MADSIQITFDGVDNTGNATNSAIANMNKLGQAAKKVGADAYSGSLIQSGNKVSGVLMENARRAGLSSFQMMNLAESTGMWSRSQLDAAGRATLLSRKSLELTDAVKRGVITTDEAGKAYKNFARSTMTVGDRYKEMSQRLEGAQASMMKIGLAGAGVVVAGKALYNFGKSGAELEFTKVKFDRLSTSVGTTSSIFMSQLRAATKGTVSDMELARNGADLFQLGLARTADEAVRLSKVQTALGMDTGELTLALANQSKRRLDQLGLSLNKFNEIESKLKDKGMSKEDAFREAFLQTAEQTVVTTGNRADSSYGDFLRLEASGKNLMDTMKQKAPDTSLGWLFGGDTMSQTANKVSMFMNGVSNLMSGKNVLDFSGGLGADSWVRKAGAQDMSSLWSMDKNNPLFRAGGSGFGQQAGPSTIGLSAVQNYTAMAYKYGQPKGGPQQAPAGEAAQIDYTAMVSGALNLTSAQDKYSQSLSEINAKMTEQQAIFDKYSTRYGENSKKAVEAKTNMDALREATVGLNAEQDKLTATYALNALQQDEAMDPQKAYDFAAASGLITKEAASQYKAIDKVNAAYKDGKISAEQAAQAIRLVSGDVSALNGMTSEAFVDVYIKVHGSIPQMTTAGLHEQTTTTSTGRTNVLGGGRAKGDKDLQRGFVGEVGEQGTEGLIFGSDGKVKIIPNNAWKLMKEWGVTPDAGFASGTAGGHAGSRFGAGVRQTVPRRRISGDVFSSSSGRESSAPAPEIQQMQQSITVMQDAIKQLIDATTNGAPSTVNMSRNTIIQFGKAVGAEVAKAVG